ncbi:MAG: DUF4040 domain-containing protein [Desulfobacteraceae bacterium]|nr:MAG: DUF4040 domain-containing protein [Desulfobacteraceae bacterium]
MEKIFFVAGLLLPWVWAALLALVPRKVDEHARDLALFGAVLAALLLTASFVLSGASASTETVLHLSWVPEIGLDLVVVRDGLAESFALLIAWISVLVTVYSRSYLPHANHEEGSKRSEASFYALMSGFSAAMLALVFSGNLLQFYLFWELTGIASYLLIGYWNHQKEARAGALLALWQTVAGGVAMLVGFFWIGTQTGLWSIAAIMDQAATLQGKSWLPYCAAFVCIGALAKSSQFPFMGWLPAAMNAPTPVSAFLHSSALVAAGIFLLARFYPLFHSTGAWWWFLVLPGAIGAVYGGFLAFRQGKMKPLLAYSTISQYAFMFIGFGLGSKSAAEAALFAFFVHALIKAGLFMTAGSVTHITGDKELEEVGGLRRSNLAFAIVGIALGLALAGIPGLGKFYYEEELLKSVIKGGHSLLVYLVLLAGGMLSLMYMLRFLSQIFFGRPKKEDPHPVPAPMALPMGILAGAAILVSLFPGPSSSLLNPALESMLQSRVHFKVHLEINAIFWTSSASLALGAVLWWVLRRFGRGTGAGSFLPESFSIGGVQAALGYRAASRFFLSLHSGYLPSYLRFNCVCFLALTALLWVHCDLGFRTPSAPLDPGLASTLFLTAATAAATLFVRRHLTFVLLLTMAGFAVSGAFVLLGAPNVALAQVLVETLIDLSIIIALRETLLVDPDETLVFPDRKPDPGRWVVAIGIGAVIGLGTYWAAENYPFESVGQWYASEAHRQSGMEDFVSAILTDFRALDTLVEILVFTTGVVGVIGLYWHEEVSGE